MDSFVSGGSGLTKCQHPNKLEETAGKGGAGNWGFQSSFLSKSFFFHYVCIEAWFRLWQDIEEAETYCLMESDWHPQNNGITGITSLVPCDIMCLGWCSGLIREFVLPSMIMILLGSTQSNAIVPGILIVPSPPFLSWMAAGNDSRQLDFSEKQATWLQRFFVFCF